MIIKNPYITFIKLFKPLHLIMACLVFILIYCENTIITVYNEYIESYSLNFNIETIADNPMIEKIVYIIPIVLIVFFGILLGILVKKQKPVVLYFFGIIIFLIILIINAYTITTLNKMLEVAISIKVIKLIYDLLRIIIFFEFASVIVLIIRGLGIDSRLFDFESDIKNILQLNDNNTEVEFNIDVDIDEAKRNNKRSLRNLKYLYLENRFFVNVAIVIIVFVIVLSFIMLMLLLRGYKEGKVYPIDGINFKINKTYILDSDYNGEKLSDNKLVVLKIEASPLREKQKIVLKDLNLEIKNMHFKNTLKYNNELKDIGKLYDNDYLTSNKSEYIIVFEIPESYANRSMKLNYNIINKTYKFELKPQTYNNYDGKELFSIKQKVDFSKTVGDINLTINNYDLQNRFIIYYDFCVNSKECHKSKEYIQDPLEDNEDKVILKLNYEFEDNSNLKFNNFYDFFNQYGYICYTNDSKTKCQSSSVRNLKSKKTKQKNILFLTVNKESLDADSLFIKFKIRGYEYQYNLK